MHWTTLRLPYRPPLAWDFLLAFYRARAIAGLEVVSDHGYRRLITHGGQHGLLDLTHAEGDALTARVLFPEPDALPAIVHRLRQALDLDADVAHIGRELSRDPALRPLVRRRPGLRVAGAFSAFEQGVRAILGQQVSVVAAIRLASRMTARWGEAVHFTEAPDLTHAFPSAATLAEADIASLGMPRARAAAISAFARAVLNEPDLLEPGQDLAHAVPRLKALKGCGEWTAQYIALRALGAADAFPASDVALLRALPGIDGRRLMPDELLARAERWRPWRAYAAQHLWAQDALG